jgi:hypothetical protein
MADPPIAINEELDYSAPPVQWEFTGGRHEQIQPVESDVDAKFIKFIVPNNYMHQLIQPGRAFLRTTCRLVNAKTGAAMSAAELQCGVTDNIASTMWYNQTVTFGHHVIERTDDTYPYKAKIHQDINWSALDRDGRGQLLGYSHPDVEHKMESTSSQRATEDTFAQDGTSKLATFTKGAPDTPLAARNRDWFTPQYAPDADDQHVHPTDMIYTPNLWCTPFDLPVNGPVLPPNIPLQISLMRSSPEFYMMDGNTGGESKFKLVITDIKLVVWYVGVTPETWDKMGKQIATEGLKIYLPQRYNITKHVLDPQTSQTMTLIANDSMPSRLFFVIVDGDAMSGNKAKNPFNFQHCDMIDYHFTKGGQVYPQGERNELDFNHKGRTHMAWLEFLKATGVPQDGLGNIISADNYAGGSTIIGVNFTAMVDEGEKVQHIISPGQLQLALRFKTAPQGKQLLVIKYYDNDYIQITKDGQVTTSFL